MDEWFEGIKRAGINAAVEALSQGGIAIQDRAKELAPVRKVFTSQDSSYSTRLKSISEIEGDRKMRRNLGLGAESAWINPPSTVERRAPQLLSLRGVTPGTHTMERPSAQQRLTRRGRYELHSGRSITARSQLGGTLRDEIQALEVALDGSIIRVIVISPTEYAMFQEYGTRHNPAHPYLRPAFHEEGPKVLARTRSAVFTAANKAAREGSVRFKVAARMRVR